MRTSFFPFYESIEVLIVDIFFIWVALVPSVCLYCPEVKTIEVWESFVS
jgi:hypothetical protein